MQRISRNIFISVMLHSVLLAAVAAIGNSSLQQPKKLLIVSLFDALQEAGTTTKIPPAALAADRKNAAPVLVRPPQDTRAARLQPEQHQPVAAETAAPPAPLHRTLQEKGAAADAVPLQPVVNRTVGGGVSGSEGRQSTAVASSPGVSGFVGREAGGMGVSTAGTHMAGEIDPALAKKIRDTLQSNLVYPYLARKKRIEGTVLAEFRLNNTGMPENMKIVRTSHYAILDEAAKETIQKAAPFPAQNKRVEIPITFRLSEHD
ncbi:MAG: hypothetical protein C0402_07245 [Thermodesulfovibrio sp.]|nr:hypothetical protein [Thermodesulfovibrio sp.]